MANVFDQFDAQSQPGAAPNPFDQFDPPANVFDQFDGGPSFTTPFKAAARGLGAGTGAAIAGFGTATNAQDRKTLALFDAIDAGQKLGGPDLLNLQASVYAKAPPAVRKQMRDQAAGISGAATDLQTAGADITQATQSAIPLTPGEQDSLVSKVPEMVTYAAPAVVGMMATKGAGAGPMLGTGATIMGAQGADQGFQDALAHGASLDDAYKAATTSAAIQGGLGALPVGLVLDRINAATGNMFTRALTGAVTQGGTQSLIGMVQQALTNLEAKGLYDPQRGLADGVTDAAILGALGGGLTGGTLGALPKGAPREAALSPAADAGATPAVPAGALPDHLMPSAGDVVGLNTRGGTPQRVTIDSVNGGHVFFTDEAGVKRGTTAADFSRDLTAAPEPKAVTPAADVAPAPSVEPAAAPRPFDDDLFGLPGSEEPTPQGNGTADSPVIAQTAVDVQRAADQTAVPTEAQKESGNYQKGHLDVQGLKIAIETPKGAERSGISPTGGKWSVEMPDHYGYVKRTVGGDGENVDVYIGDHPEAPDVTVIDQVDPKTGRFDEHKALIGFDDPAKAIASYDAAFSDDSGPSRRSAAVTMPMDQFKDWLKSGKTKEPIGGQEAEPFQPSEEPGYFQKLKDEHTRISREAGYPDEDKLWQLPREEIDALSDRVNNQEETTERAIYGDDYGKVQKLYRKANSSWDISGADKAQAELDAYHEAMSPEKKTMLDQYEQSNPGPHKDSIKVIQDAMRETEWTPDEPIENIAREAAYGLRQVTDPRKILDVPKGGASVEAQAAYIRINRGIKAMRERGVPAADVANRLVRGLEDQGFKHGDAGDFVHDFLTESQSRFGGQKKIGDDVSAIVAKPHLGEPEVFDDSTAEVQRVADQGGKTQTWMLDKGRKTGHEYTVATRPDGSIAMAGTSNEKGGVRFTLDVVQDLDKPGSNLRIEHNHPLTAALSNDDVEVLAWPGAGLQVAISHDGAVSGASLSDAVRALRDQYGRETVGKLLRQAYDKAYALARQHVNDLLAQELTMRALGQSGLVEYYSSHPIGPKLQPLVDDIASALKEAYDNAGLPEIHENTAAGIHRPPAIGSAQGTLAAISQRHAEMAAGQRAGPAGDSESQGSPQRRDQATEDRPIQQRNAPEDRPDRDPADTPIIDTIRAPDGRPATAAEIAVEASRLARMPRDSTLGKLRKTFSYVTLPVALASKDRLSANLFGAVMDRFRRLNALENEAVPQASPYFRLKRPAMDRVNQVMEAARLYGLDLPDDGRSIVLQVPEERTPYGSPRPELSKPGQVLALSPEETAAYHSLKGFFQNRLTQMGEALARSRGYDGEFTREAIQAQMEAATAAGRRVPKSLSRAMQAFEMTEEMQRAGYVPFNRYGDYFVRVRPIDPASGDQGGLWFVPKQSVFQDVQVKMDGSNEQIPVKEKVTELRQQYPADRFHIETGKTETLGGKNVLMTANIPQLEKIFMMLDRPGTDASAAILDDLMDKLFEARKAGFRKQAQNVRGYCVAPDTKILTADMRWVEAKSLADGDEIVGFDEFNREWRQRRKMRVGLVESSRRIVQPCYKIVMSSGRSIVVSADHRLLGGHQNDRAAKWEYAKDIKVGRILKTFPFHEPKTDFESGWFSGILDGEGWISYSTRPTTKKNLVLGWAQLPGLVLERSLLIANSAGLKANHLTRTTRTTHSAVMGPWSAIACLQMFQPIRLIAKRKWDGIPLPTAEDADVVISVEFVGDREVIALQTSTQTFIANGICSHNSTDFERSIADYIRQSSAHVSNMEHRNTIDAAKAQMDDHPDKNIRSFWDNYIRDLDTPDGAFSQAARKVGFFQFIWGSFASAATNILQTPGVTLPALAAWTGPRAPALLGQAMTEAASAIRIGARGFEIDWSKVGRTDAERAAIKRARQEGVMDPRMSEEAQGKNVTSSQRLRPYAKRMGHVWDAGSSMFSTAESINRIAAWLSHFRAAQNPQLVETMARVFAKDQNFQRMRMAGGLTPEAIARFATEDTQFIGGKVNRAPITRGPGAWLLQFKPYLLNYLRIFHRMATKMGWRGQMAFSLGMGALVAQSGLFGLPYAQDVTDVGEWLYKQFTGIDPMIEARIKQVASDSAMGPLGGELVGHGLGRLGPVDISNRTSMGQIVPSGNPMDLFPLASGTVGRGMQFWNEMSQGRPWTAWAGASGLALGKGGEDIAKAVALSKEGYATQKGNIVEFPSEVTPGQIISRGLGFQPSDLSKELEQRTEANRMKESTTLASSKLLTDVSRELALAQDATRSGDKATADKHYARYSALIKANAAQLADPSIPMWQKVPPIQARAIKAAVKQQIDYENSVLSRTSKLKRGAVQSIQSAP